MMIKLQGEIKKEFKDLEIIYKLKIFVSKYEAVLWKGNYEL